MPIEVVVKNIREGLFSSTLPILASLIEKGTEVSSLSLFLMVPGGKAVPMVVAVIGIPAGLELVTRKLEELRKAGKVSLEMMQGRLM